MKRVRQVALFASSLFLAMTAIMLLFTALFSRFKAEGIVQIERSNFKILTLYIGTLLAIASVYAAYFYSKPNRVTPFFYFILGVLGVLSLFTVRGIISTVIIAILSMLFIYVSVFGYYYQFQGGEQNIEKSRNK